MKRKDRYGKKNRLICAGVALMIMSFVFAGFNLWDDFRAGRSASDALRSVLAQAGRLDDMSVFPDMEMPTVESGGIRYIGELRVPELGLELPVISSLSSQFLRTAPCRYSGSAYNDTMVIAAHNYISHFGRLNQLSQNSEIVFVDVGGNEFVYRVAELEVLQPYDVKQMKENDHDLTLFTCTIGGRSRVTVRCDRDQSTVSGCNGYLSDSK